MLPADAGGRLWLWALAALNQYGDATERNLDLVAAIRYFAEEAIPDALRESGGTTDVMPADDPLVRHLTSTSWCDEEDPPHDTLRQEVVSLLMLMDGDPDLWREGAREVTRHGTGYQRVVARAVLRETDPSAAVELDMTA